MNMGVVSEQRESRQCGVLFFTFIIFLENIELTKKEDQYKGHSTTPLYRILGLH